MPLYATSLNKIVGAVPEDLLLPIAQCLVAAMDGAHEAGYLHNDIKPSNVFLDSKGEPYPSLTILQQDCRDPTSPVVRSQL